MGEIGDPNLVNIFPPFSYPLTAPPPPSVVSIPHPMIPVPIPGIPMPHPTIPVHVRPPVIPPVVQKKPTKPVKPPPQPKTRKPRKKRKKGGDCFLMWLISEMV